MGDDGFEPRCLEIAALTPFASEDELISLIQGFQACTLTHDEWNHRAHLAVASCYVHDSRQQALDLIRAGIKRLNMSQGVVDTPTSGYHETITRFWVAMISELAHASSPRLVLVNLALEKFADKHFVLGYYSRERIMSAEARAGWVEPDLQPLP